MKTILFLALFAQFFAQFSFSQTATLKGKLTDAATGETLPGVNIILEKTKAGTVTDENGIFTISDLKPGTYTLTFSYLGFTKKKLENLTVSAGQVLDIGTVEMEEEAIPLSQVTVTPGSFSIMGEGKLSRQTLTAQDLKNMSWAEDITRAVSRLPGISSSDYSSRFSVRGGEANEVLITLDGMELYEPFHQRDYSGGLFSIVDIETIQGIELMTGGFSAPYGNRLSGVFNMRTKHIADNERHSSVGWSVMNGRAYTDGKFAQNKGTYIFSARRSMLDLLFRAVGATENLPSFYDAMAKVEYQLNPKHILSFHAIQAGDKLKIRDISDDGNFDKNDTKYDNTYAWLTLKSFYTPSLSSRTLLYSGLVTHNRQGSFHKYEPSDKGNFSLSDQRDYSFFGVKQDWDWQASNKLFLNAGFDVRPQKASFDYLMDLAELRADSNEVLYDYPRVTDVNKDVSGLQTAVYLSGRFKILPKLIMESGLRYDHASYTGDDLVSPRVSLAYAFGKNTFLRGAWGYYYQTQFMDNLEVNDGITEYNPAELAKHYVLGFEHLLKNGINLRVEAYYKDYSHVSPISQNTRDHLEIFPEQRNDYLRVHYNGSEAKGIEFFLKYDQGGKFSWWLSYALAKATDDVRYIEFNGLLQKRTGDVPRLNDQRHTIYADLNYRPNQKWHFSFSWQYYRGWPRTDYTYHYQILPNGDYHFYPVHGEFNGVIYPAYHRMDVRANRRFDLQNSHITVFLHVINIYNRKNLKKFDLDTRNDAGEYSIDENGNYVPFHDDTYWFGLLPVIGGAWEF
ncbi:MAG: TonB-dependent receptor [Lewinellaceae bacterium]|nr:TonB-dependent receptor [Saprospiraceae bacterium]MCB9339354.1 TonB-dependent receptor [Lewinellaceae bacterium]